MNPSRKSIQVNLAAQSYRIEIGTGLLDEIGNQIVSLGNISQIAVITDSTVEPLYAQRIADSLTQSGFDLNVFVVPEGEESKSLEMTNTLWNCLLEYKLDRKAVLIALGGGVIGDLTGFVASTYARGVRFFQIPTTLLAQTDSSVGGKVGINFNDTKNMIGSFYQPQGVLIDPQTLETLSDRQYRAGLGEVVKYGASLDSTFFSFLENNVDAINRRDVNILSEIIAQCCQMKTDIVINDEKETTGLRALLNYGHTFAHSFEAAAGPGNILHGEAVAVGLIFAIKLALNLKDRLNGFQTLDENFLAKQIKLNQELKLPFSLNDLSQIDPQWNNKDISPEKLFHFMTFDKKNENAQLCFVLPTSCGHCQRVSGIEPSDVLDVLTSSLK
ncbi:MAG: 3-dehydroquinate synthase [Planctomycetia bacterium]|nr:3-dehydroquinate synthase [Planctomycetia bacterium]